MADDVLLKHPLLDVLDRLRTREGYRFALLRHTLWDKSILSGGDIDLLGDDRSVRALIFALYELAIAGLCHVRIRRSNRDKTRVTIYSADWADRIEMDLWVNLWQLDAGRRCLRWRDVAHLMPSWGAFHPLPLELETAIYIQHLIAKQKNLSATTVQQRLSFYAVSCREHALGELSGWLYRVLSGRKIEPELADLSLTIVLSRTRAAIRAQNVFGRLSRRLQKPRPLIDHRVVALIGCDGVGKSSVMDGLARNSNMLLIVEKLLSKQLYRTALTFRAAYKINKASIKMSSESTDEWLAPLAFSCARRNLSRRLRERGDRPPSVLLLDRFLGDFLYVGRKGDRGRFACLSWLCRRQDWQCPIVHFVVPFAILSARKQEISELGQRRYDMAMIDFYTKPSRATDYLIFCNSGSVTQAVTALSSHFMELFASDPVPRGITPHVLPAMVLG